MTVNEIIEARIADNIATIAHLEASGIKRGPMTNVINSSIAELRLIQQAIARGEYTRIVKDQ